MVKREREETLKERGMTRERKPAIPFTHPADHHRTASGVRRTSGNRLENKKFCKSSLEDLFKLQSKKKPWSEEEDKLVIRLIGEHGLQRWRHIASFVRGRSGKQVRERWRNQLDPDLNKNLITEHEDETIVEAWLKFGNQWSEIARLLAGRTDNAIKNYWNSANGKQMRERILGPDFMDVKPAITAPFKNAKKSILAKHAAMKKDQVLRDKQQQQKQQQYDTYANGIATPPESNIGSPHYDPASPTSCPSTPLTSSKQGCVPKICVKGGILWKNAPKKSKAPKSKSMEMASKGAMFLESGSLQQIFVPQPAHQTHSCSFVGAEKRRTPTDQVVPYSGEELWFSQELSQGSNMSRLRSLHTVPVADNMPHQSKNMDTDRAHPPALDMLMSSVKRGNFSESTISPESVSPLPSPRAFGKILHAAMQQQFSVGKILPSREKIDCEPVYAAPPFASLPRIGGEQQQQHVDWASQVNISTSMDFLSDNFESDHLSQQHLLLRHQSEPLYVQTQQQQLQMQDSWLEFLS